jgi:hypothetical protein
LKRKAAAGFSPKNCGGLRLVQVAAQIVPNLMTYWPGMRNTSQAQRFTFAPFASSSLER